MVHCIDHGVTGLNFLIHVKLRQKKLCVFGVTGLKILGRVGTHIFFYFFSGEKYNFMHSERHFAFQNAKKKYFFQKT